MIAVALAGGLGAVCRAGLDGLVRDRPGKRLWRDVLGCFLLGAATSAFSAMDPRALRAVTTGFFGGFTTFSTAMLDAVELARAGRRLASAGLVLGTAGSGLLAFLGGTAFASIF